MVLIFLQLVLFDEVSRKTKSVPMIIRHFFKEKYALIIRLVDNVNTRKLTGSQ